MQHAEGYLSSAFWRWINNPWLWQIPRVQLHITPLCADGDSRTAHHLHHTDPTIWSYQTESWWRLRAQILFAVFCAPRRQNQRVRGKPLNQTFDVQLVAQTTIWHFLNSLVSLRSDHTRAHTRAPASPRLQIKCVSALVGVVALSGWSESENRRHTSTPPLPSPAQCEEQLSSSERAEHILLPPPPSSSSLLFSPVWIQSCSRAEVLPTCTLGKLRTRLHTQPFCPRTNLTVGSLHDDAERATLAPRSPALPNLYRGVQFIWVHRGALWEGREVRRILQSDITGSEQSEGGQQRVSSSRRGRSGELPAGEHIQRLAQLRTQRLLFALSVLFPNKQFSVADLTFYWTLF